MKKSNSRKANFILLFVTVGFLISYPLNFNFWGKLLSTGFCAAMIGGVADWFGITALFRKPLGIPFRTDIIVRNREKIYASLADMVQNELITKDNLQNKICSYGISKMLLDYLLQYGGKEDLVEVSNKIIKDLILKIDFGHIAGLIDDIVKDSFEKARLTPVLIEAVERGIKNQYTNVIFETVTRELIDIVQSPGVHSIMTGLAENLLQKFRESSREETLITRFQVGSVLNIIKVLGITPSYIAMRARQVLIEFLIELKNPGSSRREMLDKWMENTLSDLKQDAAKQSLTINTIKAIAGNTNSEGYFLGLADSYRQKFANNIEEQVKLKSLIESVVEKIVNNFSSNELQKNHIDELGSKLLSGLVEENHGKIGKLVRDRLDQLDDKDLVELIESKAGNDLQIVRINGSVVGGITGMLLFIITYLVQGSW